VANKMRLFKVVKMPVPRADEPVPLQQVLGYEFYSVDPETKRTRELVPTEAHSPYWDRLDDLAHDIADLITALERDRENPFASASSEPQRSAVYLAETGYDLKDRRDAIRRDLQSHGYAVLPDQPLPDFGPDYAAAVRAHLEHSLVSAHLVGRSYGNILDGSTESVLAVQHELAVERAKSGGFHRLIWIPPDLSTEDERQRRFIEHLEGDSRLQSGADLLKTPFEDFKSLVHLRLKQKPAASRPNGGARRIYVICEERDRDAVLPVLEFLHNSGCEVIPSAFDGDEASILQDHRDNLVECDAVLMYYGAGNAVWLRRQLRELDKSPGYGRTKPLLARGIFIGPPMNDEKAHYRSHETVVVKWAPQLSQQMFEPFLDLLG
jgi:hypothetical protein